jgi:hypothetical protein
MSTPATPPLWTAAQQSWLQAMGYTVFVDGNVEAAAEPVVELHAIPADNARVPDAARHDAAPSRRSAPPADDTPAPPRRPAPTTVDAGETAPPAAARGTRRPVVRMPPPLQIALLRASGCNPNDPETQALMAGWNLDDLRGNAAAKRALWPQLRALRKKARP